MPLFYILVGAFFGFVTAWILSAFLSTSRLKRLNGRLVINSKDPEKDTVHLEFTTPFGEMINEEVIVLKVDKDI